MTPSRRLPLRASCRIKHNQNEPLLDLFPPPPLPPPLLLLRMNNEKKIYLKYNKPVITTPFLALLGELPAARNRTTAPLTPAHPEELRQPHTGHSSPVPPRSTAAVTALPPPGSAAPRPPRSHAGKGDPSRGAPSSCPPTAAVPAEPAPGAGTPPQ